MSKHLLFLLLCTMHFGYSYGRIDSLNTLTKKTIESNFSHSNPSSVIKTNLLYVITGTLNVGADFKLKGLYSLNTSVGVNPLKFGDKIFQFFYIQPEIRKWKEEVFEGDYWSLQTMYMNYRIGGLELPFGLIGNLKNSRYEGHMAGLSLNYGRTWPIGDRWRLEASVGAGYMMFHYNRYENLPDGKLRELKTKHLPMLPNIAISVAYVLQPIKKYRFINVK